MRPLAGAQPVGRMDSMDHDEITAALAGIEDTLASMEAGRLEATTAERAYLAGAAHAFRAALGEAQPPA